MTYKYLLVIISFLISGTICPLPAREVSFTDSLQQIINASSGREKAKRHLQLADFYLKTDLQKSLEQSELAMNIALATEDSLLQVDCLYQRGIAQYLLGIHDEALATYQAVLDFAIKIKYFSKAALILNDIGTLVKKQGNIEQSKEYFEHALRMSRQAGDSLQIANSMNNLGIVYELQGDFESAMQNFRESARIKEKYEDFFGLAYNLDNMGMLFTKMNKYEAALDKFLQAAEIREKLGDIRGKAVIYNNIGEMYLMQGSVKKAKEYFMKALPLSMDTNFKDLTQHIYKMLSDAYKKENDYASALIFYEKHDALRDSLFNETRSRQIIEMEKKYESEKNKQQIELQQAKIAEQDAQLSRNYALLAILVLSLLLLSGGFYFYKNRQTQKREREIEKAALNASIMSQEDERKRFAQDLHDGMGQLISACKIQISQLVKEKANNGQDKYFDRSQRTLDEMHREIRNIAFNLMPATLIRKGFNAAVQELAEKINTSADFKISVHKSGSEIHLAEQDAIFLYRITQEWLNNVLKYSNATHVDLQILNHNNEFIVMIEDDGDGFDLNRLYNGKGNGWTNIQSRIQYLKGSADIDSQPGRKGTTFTLNIPGSVQQTKRVSGDEFVKKT